MSCQKFDRFMGSGALLKGAKSSTFLKLVDDFSASCPNLDREATTSLFKCSINIM